MSVKELSQQIKLSYMGTKEICLDLHKSGYLSTWRRPVPRGRPEMLYRLTRKADELFPRGNNTPMLHMLDAAARLFGATSPGKLLLAWYQDLEKQGAARVKGTSLEERMKWLARWRDATGHFASVEPGEPPVLVERHHPMQDILEAHPEAVTMEENMIGRLLATEVRREEKRLDGSVEWRFIPRA